MPGFYKQSLWILEYFLTANPDFHHRLLVAVELCGTAAGGGEAGCGLTVVLRGGRRIEVNRAFEEAVLRRLVYVLERV